MNNLAYFIAGALSTIMLLLLEKPIKKVTTKKKKWQELTSVTQKYDFDYEFKETNNCHNVMLGIIEATYNEFKGGYDHFKDHLIAKGNYSVSAITTLRFVKREDNE